MKKHDLLELFQELDFHPGKQLGQNFLMDENLLDFIIRQTQPQAADTILEVGPGFGALTRKLLDAGAKVIAVEFDRRLCEYLRNNIQCDSFTLIESDICRVELDELPELQNGFRCIANLPYAVSTPFIAHLLEMRNPPSDMFFMLQREMAERLAASNETKNYGALSVRVQHVYDLHYARTVPKQVFFPPPDIDSALLSFTCKSQIPSQQERLQLKTVAKLAFSQRRKKMLNLLAGKYGKHNTLAAFEELGLNETVRAEQLDVETFAKLAKKLTTIEIDNKGAT